MDNDLKIKLALVIVLLSLTIYSNSLGGEFVYDDQYFVVRNVSIRDISSIPSFFTNASAVAFSELSKEVYRPITTISYALDYMVWKLDVFGYHLVNTLLHSANAVLVFALAGVIFADIWAAFFAGLLFACHPIQTEAVSWISGRSNVLFLLFYLLSLMLYIDSGRKGSVGKYLLSLAACIAALFSKEMAVTLPLIIAIYDIHFAGREKFRIRVLKWAPYFVLSAAFIFIRSGVLKTLGQCGWWGSDPYYTFLSMSNAMAGYIRLLIFPVDLCVFYNAEIIRSVADIRAALPIGIFTALVLAMPFIYRRSRVASFCIIWFFAAMLPVSNIVPLKALIAERFLYLPSIGFCIGLSALIFFNVRRALAAALATAIVLTYSVLTLERNKDWANAVSISESVVKVSPLNPWGYASLGAAYMDKGLYPQAIKALKKSIVLSKDYSTPKNILGFCYLKTGKYEEAVKYLEEARAASPGNLEMMNALGTAYANLERYDDAIREFSNAIKTDPMFVSAYLNLGAVYEKMGENKKALEQYNYITGNIKSAQDISVALIRIGDVKLKEGDREGAMKSYNEALSIGSGMTPELKDVILARISKISPE